MNERHRAETLHFARYRLLAVPEPRFPLHEANGSMLRGVFGTALARWDARHGDDLYPSVFEGGEQAGPRPFRVVSYYPQDLLSAPAGLVAIEYDLFAEAIPREQSIACVWRLACEGLGFGTERVRAEVVAVERLESGRIEEDLPPPSEEGLLELITPTALKIEGRAADPTLHRLLVAAARRVAVLIGLDLDPTESSRLVASPIIVQSVAHRRSSLRSGPTQLRGVTGVWRIEGVPNERERLLFQAMRRLGVGRGTVFGMGRVAYRPRLACLEEE